MSSSRFHKKNKMEVLKSKSTLKRKKGGFQLQAFKKDDLIKLTFENLLKNILLLDIEVSNVHLTNHSNTLSIINPENIKDTKNELLEDLLNRIIFIRLQGRCAGEKQFFSGTKNVVCKVKHSNPRSIYAVRISKERYNEEEIKKSYMEEVKLLVQLSKDKITPYIYDIGLCCTINENKTNSETFHVYTIMESLDMDLHEYFKLIKNVSFSPVSFEKIIERVNHCIAKFSKVGLNADMRATNILCNVDNHILRELKCIDIDHSFFLRKGSLCEICKKLSAFWKREEITQLSVRQEIDMFAKAMEYIFWLEIYCSGLRLVQIREYIEFQILGNRKIKLFLSVLFLSRKFGLGFLSAIQNIFRKQGSNFFRTPSEFDDLIFMKKRHLVDYMTILKNHKNNDSFYKVVADFLDTLGL